MAKKFSVYVRPNKTGKGKPWIVRINVGGKRTQRKVDSELIAEAVAAQIRLDIINGEFGKITPPKEQAPTFREYSEKWLEEWASQLRQSTQNAYLTILTMHVLPVFGDRPIDTITRGEVKSFLLQKFKSGLSQNRTLCIKDVISSVFNFNEFPNPAQGVTKKIFPKGNTRMKQLSDDDVFNESEVEKLLETAKAEKPEFYHLFLIAAKTGMRLGEVLALKWGNVDIDRGKNGAIWVKQSFREGRLTPPKNGKTRAVEMSAALAAELKAQLPKDTDELIISLEGDYLPQHRARSAYKTILKKAELKYIKFHGLRHSYASIMLSKGALGVKTVGAQFNQHHI